MCLSKEEESTGKCRSFYNKKGHSDSASHRKKRALESEEASRIRRDSDSVSHMKKRALETEKYSRIRKQKIVSQLLSVVNWRVMRKGRNVCKKIVPVKHDVDCLKLTMRRK